MAIPGRPWQFFVLVTFALAGGSHIWAQAGRTSVEPVVTVTGGEIRGRTLAAPGGAVFKGIPFAQPPVGDLRWREPQAVVAWEGVRDAGSYNRQAAWM